MCVCFYNKYHLNLFNQKRNFCSFFWYNIFKVCSKSGKCPKKLFVSYHRGSWCWQGPILYNMSRINETFAILLDEMCEQIFRDLFQFHLSFSSYFITYILRSLILFKLNTFIIRIVSLKKNKRTYKYKVSTICTGYQGVLKDDLLNSKSIVVFQIYIVYFT